MFNKRDTSGLYSGITSVSKRTKRDVVNEEKVEKKQKLTPASKIVFDLIEKEKEKVTDITNFVLEASTPDADIKAILLARKLYREHLIGLQNQLQIIMKAKPRKKS